MKKIENFRFNDVVLYAKGWYEHTDNFMKICLMKFIVLNRIIKGE